MNDRSLFTQPSAWLPFVMSLAALAFLLGYVTIFGIARHAEEGAPARMLC